MAQRTIPEFPLLFVGAMMLTAAVSAVAFWSVRSAGLFFWWSARSWTPSKRKLLRLETKHYGPLVYTYYFAGGAYESKRFSSSVTGTEEGYLPEEVRELLKGHPVGSEVECWVNPANQQEACLDRSLNPGVWGAWASQRTSFELVG